MLKADNREIIKIKGKKYMKNLNTGEIYSMPRSITTRAIERNLQKKAWKEHNKGVAKKYRTSFSDYWNNYIENKRKEEKR